MNRNLSTALETATNDRRTRVAVYFGLIFKQSFNRPSNWPRAWFWLLRACLREIRCHGQRKDHWRHVRGLFDEGTPSFLLIFTHFLVTSFFASSTPLTKTLKQRR